MSLTTLPPNTVGAFIDSHEFTQVSEKLRSFFRNRGFEECHTQSRTSILAACEDPTTLATFNYNGEVFPLPQTGQMWLEHDQLTNRNRYPHGLFCVSTSYRSDPNPVPGRHDLIFPMFEFEMPGSMEDMIKMEMELCQSLGFPQLNSEYPIGTYTQVVKRYGLPDGGELEHSHEARLCEDFGSVYFLKDFPEYTSPFWNMSRYKGSNLARKVDVIICGQETIGSAERSCDPVDMRERFMTISNGEYAETLFSHFGRDRVMRELDYFLAHDFFPRSGGGIGFTRLLRALRNKNLLRI